MYSLCWQTREVPLLVSDVESNISKISGCNMSLTTDVFKKM
jgi:hypothetical protein